MPALPGLKICRPSSIDVTGTSGTIRADGGVNFSAVTSLSLNGVFSSTYDNYMVVARATAGSQVGLASRLRVSGADATGSNYVLQYLDANGTSVTAGRQTFDYASFPIINTNNFAGFTCYIFGPNLASATIFRNISADPRSSAFIADNVVTHSLTTSYTGITLYPTASSMTGEVFVYGFTQ